MTAPAGTSEPLAARVLGTVRSTRDEALASPVHSERTAAILGVALGVSFTVCFATGLISHQIQHPGGWFNWPARPDGLYRVNQGLHIATGLATVPLLLAKLWSVFPNLFQWPPFRNAAQVVERMLLVPLVCGSVFMLFSGVVSIAHWYPWRFSFPVAHYWMAWVTIGALVAHLGAKFATTRRALARQQVEAGQGPTGAPAGALSRRGFLGWVAAASGLVTLATVGQTVRPLARTTWFAPRRPDIGPQGLPVNVVASDIVRTRANSTDYRLRIVGAVPTPVEMTVAELRSLPRRHATLTIACVEGWSATGQWTGVPIAELLAMAGVPDDRRVEVEVRSLQPRTKYSQSILDDAQARDRDTMLALTLNGEDLHPDHGFPCRLIGPNRPGVQQTKWVTELVVS